MRFIFLLKFQHPTTASGAATTYTALSAVPSGNTVMTTATSVTDSTKAAKATITITTPPPADLADGTYTFNLFEGRAFVFIPGTRA